MGGSKCVASVKIFMGTSIVCEGDVSSAVGVEMPATEAADESPQENSLWLSPLQLHILNDKS